MRTIILMACIAIISALCAQSADKKAIVAQLDKIAQAHKDKDYATFSPIFTDNILVYGTDPGEAPFAAGAVMKTMEDAFAVEDLTVKLEIKHRNTLVNADEKTALVASWQTSAKRQYSWATRPMSNEDWR